MAFLDTLNLDDDQRYELLNYQQVFFYMSPIGDTSRDRCYHLQVVPHDEIDPSNYFTLSRLVGREKLTLLRGVSGSNHCALQFAFGCREGVTHFRGKESEFTPLPQWNREFRLFNKISEVRTQTTWAVVAVVIKQNS